MTVPPTASPAVAVGRSGSVGRENVGHAPVVVDDLDRAGLGRRHQEAADQHQQRCRHPHVGGLVAGWEKRRPRFRSATGLIRREQAKKS